MHDKRTAAPDSTAVRVALWRAMHVQVDPPPHVLEDEIGLKLAAPDDGWRRRPDMDPDGTRLFRASIVARARFIEDLVVEQARRGVSQYVILGAGLDTFAQRRPEIASSLKVFEVDRPGPQAWKRQRLIELGFGIPKWLRFVPVDFEAGGSWWERLKTAGFDAGQPAVVASTGVSHVPHEGRDRGHAAPGRGARPRIHAGHDVPAAARARGPRGASRASASGEGGASKRDAFHQLLHADGNADIGPRSRL
jgi:O-methyltransferase involved in polyketide biosynthesis